MQLNPTRLPPPPEPERHSFTPSPAPRAELLGNPDPGFRESARRVGLHRTSLYSWFPPCRGYVVIKALLSQPTLTLPEVARQLCVTPRTVRAWFPLPVRVQLLRFLLLHSRLSLSQIALRLGGGPHGGPQALDAWLPADDRFRIAREVLNNPDPNFDISARRVGLSRKSLYNWFPPTFPGHIVVKALLTNRFLTVPAVARRLWVSPQTVRGWIPAWIQVRLVRFLLLRAGLSLTQVSRRLDVPIDTLRRWFPRQQLLQIARQLLIRSNLSLAQAASRLGLRPDTLRQWFPREQRLQIARQLLIRSNLSLAQAASRLGLRPDTLRWPKLSPVERFHFARQLLVYTQLPLAQVADRLEISINTLAHWFPHLKQKGNVMTAKSKRRHIGYARVSTLDQDPEHQIKALKAAGCERIFTDQASGAFRARPELAKALNCVVGGDTLIVWKFDRLGRSLQHLIEIVTSLGERQVQLRSLTQGIDTRTPIGKMTFSIMGALAEFERCLISERTKLAAGRRQEKHQHWGRPSQFHNPERVKFAQQLLRSDLPKKEVARRLEITLPALYKWFPRGDPDRFGTGPFGGGVR